MSGGIQWSASTAPGVHSYARVEGGAPGEVKLLEVRKVRTRIESRRRAGWHTHWYFRVSRGAWWGAWGEGASSPTSPAHDKRLGFKTMREARARAVARAREAVREELAS